MIKWLRNIAISAAMAGLVISTGCRMAAITDPVIGPSYKPNNIFVQAGAWPMEVQRVAVLPLAFSDSQANAAAGRDALEPVLLQELTKSKRFECIPVTPAALKKWTNKEKWSASEMLPGDMIQNLKHELGCDAVIFPELTQYRPYPPLVIGWNIKLVSVDSQEILWSVDEVFDASEQPVANAARRFEQQRERPNPVLADSRQILISPRRFGQFTTETLVATIPEHDKH